MSEAPATPRIDQLPHHAGPVSCRVYRSGKPAPPPSHLDQISEILRQPDSLVWFDVVDPVEGDLAVLEREFNLHPLAVEDAVKAHQRPKIESYGNYWFVVVLGANVSDDGVIVLHEIAIFAGDKFLVTVRHAPAFPLEEIEERWRSHPERLRRGGGFLLYTILDTIVDGYFPIADTFEERVDTLEARLFDGRPHDDMLRDILAMKRAGQAFRKAAIPMRDILNPIIRGDIQLFAAEEIPYFRDVYDHAVRVIDQLDNLRDLASSSLEIHLSVVANRQNEVAKQLTVIATIFLPLSFLVGFFGQNFDFLVGHISGARPFWFLGIGSEMMAIALMLAYFKWRDWY